MQTRNYSQRSIDTYIHLLRELEEYFKCSIDEVTSDQVKDFLQYSITERNLSVSYINQVISAVKILQKDVLGKDWESIRIKRPRGIKKLPVVLSKEEVKSIIETTRNLKHRTILAVIYSAGLRISELISLRPSDIDSDRKQHGLIHEQKKAFTAIINCRSQNMGGHTLKCDTCGYVHHAYNSCRNRHCPKCQYLKQIMWVDKLKARLLPVKYFHIVFTVPASMHKLFYANQTICYDLLLRSASQALLKAGENPAFLGAKTGCVAILHMGTGAHISSPCSPAGTCRRI